MAVVADSCGAGPLRTVLLVGRGRAADARVRRALLDHVESVLSAETFAAARTLIRRHGPELALVQEDIGSAEALRFVEETVAAGSETRVVVVAAQPSVQLAVEFVRAGAFDYISGPLNTESARRLAVGIRDQTARAGDGREQFFSEDCPPSVPIVGRSPGIVRSLQTIRMVSESQCNPILLLGETGTGKELAAQAVHAWRCGDPESFVAVNCAALTANLLESELFGHVKGAFTGADREKTGLFELAGTGTIFLDEISEMPLDLQAKLLRVLQERKFRKVGGAREICCEATIVASSNRDLKAEGEAGRFRKDLYFRLAVFPITLPALRCEHRREDIPLLAAHFLRTSAIRPRGEIKGLTPAAEQALLNYHWPGNVRELRNVIERAMIVERSEQITPESVMLDHDQPAAPAPEPRRPARKDFSLETAEREFILRALKETGWQRTRAAALLGITRATLHAKLKRYDIQPPDAPSPSPKPPTVQEQLERDLEKALA